MTATSFSIVFTDKIYMPALQPKTSEFIATLNVFRNSEVDPFTISRLEKGINKVSVHDERYMLLGMLSAIKNDTDGTINNFGKALQLNNEETICDNFIVALGNLKQYVLARDKANEFSNESYAPSLIKHSLHYSYTFLDLNRYIDSIEKLARLKVSLPEDGLVHKKEISVMLHFTESKLVSVDELAQIGSVAMNSIEASQVEVNGNSISLAYDHEEKLRIKYYIDNSINAETVLTINENFIDNLIDQNLDLLPVVVSFIRSKNMDDSITNDSKATKVS
jgi:hypothetical protein